MLSCKILRLSSPYNLTEIEEFIRATIIANNFKNDIALRVTVFCDGIGSWSSTEPVDMFIAPITKPRTRVENIPTYRACISSWERIHDNALPPRAKVGANYINGRYAHLQARQDGYDLPIFLGRDGKISEGAGACLFMVRNGQLVTPTVTSSILESITRNTIITISRELGITVIERQIDRTELYFADEIFLCGSAADISPVISVDGFILGDGGVGPITLSLLKKYLSITSGEIPCYPEWRSSVYKF
jgi:branched-chain amino acid aminotransferase